MAIHIVIIVSVSKVVTLGQTPPEAFPTTFCAAELCLERHAVKGLPPVKSFHLTALCAIARHIVGEHNLVTLPVLLTMSLMMSVLSVRLMFDRYQDRSRSITKIAVRNCRLFGAHHMNKELHRC